MKNLVFILFVFVSQSLFSQIDPWGKVREVNIQYNSDLIKSSDLIKIEKQIVDSINRYRLSKGKNVLKYDSSQSNNARKWSDFLTSEVLQSQDDTLRLRHSQNGFIENCYAMARYCDIEKLSNKFFYNQLPSSVYQSWFNSKKGNNEGMLMNGEKIGVGVSFGLKDNGSMFTVVTMQIK